MGGIINVREACSGVTRARFERVIMILILSEYFPYLNEFKQRAKRSQKRDEVGIARSFYLRDDPRGLSTTSADRQS